MKGLLIKDFKLIKGQKNFFFLMIAVTIIMATFFDNASFMLSYLPFVLSLFTLSTISYDEFDNGNAFLFTLPISRTGYTIEKYCLALLLGGGAWIFATLSAILFNILKRTTNTSEILITAVTILPIIIIIQAILIPVQLKFGGEKGQIARIGICGLLFIMIIVIVKAAEMLGLDITAIINNLSIINTKVIVAALVVITIILLLVSIKISSSIMKKKEF